MRPPDKAFTRTSLTLGLITIALACPGCLERRIRIVSEPGGALVHLNDVEVGLTPVEVDFTYYGVYDVRLRKQGYESISTTRTAETPLHELPGIDLVAEALPTRIVNEIEWSFTLRPLDEDVDAVIERGRRFRAELGAIDALPPTEPQAGERVIPDEDPPPIRGEEDPLSELPPVTPDPKGEDPR